MPPAEHRYVLVADDNRVMADVIRFNLERAGFTVAVAHDGREAWERILSGGVEALVTDFQMPGLTGEELCRHVRRDGRFAALPVVMLSAKGLELDCARLKDELRIHEIMFKPFSPRQLVAAVCECLAGEPAAV